MIDLHSHTVFSDGVLIPAELARRAKAAGYRALAITDHADDSNLETILTSVRRVTREYAAYMDINLFCGVELTHVPPPLIASLTQKARFWGAELVIVHGQTLVEPVAEGTNLAAIEVGVDILAHPGLITELEVELAVKKNVALEITTRNGHSLSNGHVARLGAKFGAPLVINNDTHAPADLVSSERRMQIALGAGMSREDIRRAEDNSRRIVERMLRQGREAAASF